MHVQYIDSILQNSGQNLINHCAFAIFQAFYVGSNSGERDILKIKLPLEGSASNTEQSSKKSD